MSTLWRYSLIFPVCFKEPSVLLKSRAVSRFYVSARCLWMKPAKFAKRRIFFNKPNGKKRLSAVGECLGWCHHSKHCTMFFFDFYRRKKWYFRPQMATVCVSVQRPTVQLCSFLLPKRWRPCSTLAQHRHCVRSRFILFPCEGTVALYQVITLLCILWNSCRTSHRAFRLQAVGQAVQDIVGLCSSSEIARDARTWRPLSVKTPTEFHCLTTLHTP